MKLNIVEACKLAKNIEMMKRELSSMLLQDSYSCKKTEKHLRSKAAADLTDEVVEVEDKREYDLSIEDILAILDNLMDIKATLSSAIEGAKHNITIDGNGKNLSYDFLEWIANIWKIKDTKKAIIEGGKRDEIIYAAMELFFKNGCFSCFKRSLNYGKEL